MAKVIYIIGDANEESHSHSLQVGAAFLKSYQTSNPNDTIERIHVFEDDIPLIDKDLLSVWEKMAKGMAFEECTQVEQTKSKRFSAFTDQFVAADKYIFVTPVWNLFVPAMVKAYIDTTCVAKKSFRYTASGSEGLLKGKKALHIQASGGVYSKGPAMDLNFGDAYLKGILAFMGITDFQAILIEGIAAYPNDEAVIMQKAVDTAVTLAKSF